MGMRTTIIIDNDHLELLQTDDQIANKIRNAILGSNKSFGPLGEVVEQAHVDVVKLAIIGKNGMFAIEELARNPYNPKNLPIEVALLKQAADKLGYYLTKRK